MEASKISQWIDGLIQDLVDPNKSLEDSLRKTLILAYQIKNDKLRTWAESELNGYPNRELAPKYRTVQVQLMGRFLTTTFSGILQQTVRIPIEMSNEEHLKKLNSEGFAMLMGVSRLEQAFKDQKKGSQLNIPVPAQLFHAAEQLFVDNDSNIESLWISIPDLTVVAILSSIKTHLLQFLLELNEELGQDQNYSVMSNSNKVDEILNRTIGHIHAENVIFNGDNYQSKGNNNTVAQGEKVTQTVTSSTALKENLEELIYQLNKLLETSDDISSDDKADILHEVQSVKVQLERSETKFSIVRKSLQVLESLLINVASNAYTPVILEKIQNVVNQLP